MTELKDNVERRSLDSILPYGENPKKHPDEQVDKIASSIRRFGWDQPIVVDGDGTIIKGHGRYQAAQKLGLDEVPVIEQADLSEAEARAARIADNKTAESPWNDDLLASELELLEEANGEIETEVTGFETDEISDLLEPDDEPGIGDAEPLGLDEEYEVIVEVDNEQEQEQVYQKLIEEGYECRLNSM